jgi:hypothetical protein
MKKSSPVTSLRKPSIICSLNIIIWRTPIKPYQNQLDYHWKCPQSTKFFTPFYLNNMSASTSIKSEFVNVITDSTLLSTVTTEPLITVPTERAVIDITSDSSSESESLTPQKLIEPYNTVFTTPEMYKKFIKQKLTLCKDQTDFQYFDTIYQGYCQTLNVYENKPKLY